MNCRRCGTELERPGDFCLSCDTANCGAIVVEFEPDRATLTMLPPDEAADGDDGPPGGVSPASDDADDVLARTVITTTPEVGADDEATVVALRNFAGRVADEIRRKRPATVFAAGEREPLRECRAQLHHEFYRVPDERPVEAALERRGERSLAVVEAAPAEKLGGSHSTLIGGRTGREAVLTAADHPNVKKVIPGPIDAGGTGSRSGLRAKVTRADDNGNVRLLLRDGSSVQENRVVTTAMDRETGERVRDDLNEALEEAELR